MGNTPNSNGDITLVIGSEQTDYLRRLVLNDVAKQAEGFHEACAMAAGNIDNADNVDDAEAFLRLMNEGLDTLGQRWTAPPEPSHERPAARQQPSWRGLRPVPTARQLRPLHPLPARVQRRRSRHGYRVP